MATNSTPSPPLTSNVNSAQPLSPPTTTDPPPPNYITSISELRSLATALFTFQRRYDELQQHLDFIQTTIDSKLPDPSIIQTTTTATRKSPLTSDLEPINKNVNDIPSTTATRKALSIDSEPRPDTNLQQTKTVTSASVDPTLSEVQQMCYRMCGRSLRRYIVTHLSAGNKLRNDVSKALKFAANPAKLVFECFGKFYLQGRKAYTRDSPMVSGREASILGLECFLLMESEGVVLEDEVKEEAQNAAVAWRKRLQGEGGLHKACEIDAKGLLLLISCFGIPGVFDIEDIKDLIRSSNLNEISDALRCSHHLLARIPELIEQMLKYKREVEAVNIIYTFDVQDRYPPQRILKSFFSKSNEISKRKRTEDEDLLAVVNKDKKHLADLKSLLKCWENHKIDPSKSFPDLAINEKISSLEREINVLDKKVREDMVIKRKEKEVEASKRSKAQDARRLRFPGHDPLLQKAVGQAAENSFFDRLTQMNFNGGLPGPYGYNASPSVPHVSGVSLLHEYPGVPMAVPRGSVAGAGLLHEYAASPRVGNGGGFVAAATEGGFLSRDLYAASHLGMDVNMDPYNAQFYRWHGDAVPDERFVSQTYSGKPLYNGYNGLHRPSPALEGFAGLPDRPAAGSSIRSSASDLYQFADSVLESESHHKGASISGVNLRP